MTDARPRSRVDPRIRARFASTPAADWVNALVRTAAGHRPAAAALVELGPGLWAGRLDAAEVERLAEDDAVVFVEYAGSVGPD